MTVAPLREVADGVFRVDVRYPSAGRTCCYLIRHNGAAAVIDCGGKRGVAAVLEALQTLGLTAAAVEWLTPTHAHLDHAGGAGELMQQLPKAVLAGHPSAIKHLVDPYKTLAAAVRALYGDKYYDEHYGELTPIDAARTHNLSDNEHIVVGGDRPLRAVYSPGHAWHHLSIYDETASFLAAGDAYGVSYRELDNDGKSSIVPVMPPSQFNPEAMAESIRRLRALNADVVGLAHYDTPAHADDLAKQQLTALECWTKKAEEIFNEDEKNFYQRMLDYLLGWAAEQAAARGADADAARQRHQIDSHLSARGFEHYLKKQRDAAAN